MGGAARGEGDQVRGKMHRVGVKGVEWGLRASGEAAKALRGRGLPWRQVGMTADLPCAPLSTLPENPGNQSPAYVAPLVPPPP